MVKGGSSKHYMNNGAFDSFNASNNYYKELSVSYLFIKFFSVQVTLLDTQ